MNILKNIINVLINIIPINENKIMFQSGRKRIDGNPYAIYKELKKDTASKYKPIWIVEKDADVSMLPKEDYAYTRTLKGLYHTASSKYIIRSQSIGGIKKRKKQIYIQTWHGAGDFKKCGYDCLKEEDRPSETMEHAREWDYLISTDERNDTVMRSSVNFTKTSYILGNASTDSIVNATDEDRKKVLEKLGLTTNTKKIIMYAPTFRDDELNDKEVNNLRIMSLSALKDYIVLLRMHPLMNDKVKNIKMPENFINACDYPDINDLYLITDILITDYSSIIFPYMCLNKNLILYPYDMDHYISLRGGFYLDYNSLPGPICYSEEELIKAIETIDDNKPIYDKKTKEFNEKYNSLNDGKVCKRIIEYLKEGKFN